MYAKVFQQIFHSSISQDYIVRHVFMDLLVLADKDGIVDMTPDSIAAITRVPLQIVTDALRILSEPDPNSRSSEEDGRRIVLLDSHRNWGWHIVNHEKYKLITDDDARKEYFREYKRKQRQQNKRVNKSKNVQDSPRQSKKITHIDIDVDIDTNISKTKHRFALPVWVPIESWNAFIEMRSKGKHPLTEKAKGMIIVELQKLKDKGCDPKACLDASTMNGWRGVFEPRTNGGNGNGNGKTGSRIEEIIRRRDAQNAGQLAQGRG